MVNQNVNNGDGCLNINSLSIYEAIDQFKLTLLNILL